MAEERMMRVFALTAVALSLPAFAADPTVEELLKKYDGVMGPASYEAEATMTAIMCRTAAYTGDLVKWSDLMENQNSGLYNLTMHPTAEDFEKGSVVAPKDEIPPVPGNG